MEKRFLASVLMLMLLVMVLMPAAEVHAAELEVLNCDSAEGWLTDVGGGQLGEFTTVGVVDTADFKEGTGALSMNSKDSVAVNAFLNQSVTFVWTGNAFDVGCGEEDAVLSMWVYASNDNAFSVGAKIQIGSAGVPDVDNYEFVLNNGGNKGGVLKAGWNKIEWKLSDADKIGNPDLTKINFIKLYSILTPADTIVKIDDVQLINAKAEVEPPVEQDPPAQTGDVAAPVAAFVGMVVSAAALTVCAKKRRPNV